MNGKVRNAVCDPWSVPQHLGRVLYTILGVSPLSSCLGVGCYSVYEPFLPSARV